MTKGAAAEGKASPERNRIRGVRGNGGDPSEKKSGKGNETSAAGDGIERAAENGCEEQQDCFVEVKAREIQAKNVSSACGMAQVLVSYTIASHYRVTWEVELEESHDFALVASLLPNGFSASDGNQGGQTDRS